MYHIKSDKRSQKSAEIITDTFLSLTRRKPFQNISVSDIERESGVARSTFYRLFDNTVDILSYKCDMVFQGLIETHKLHILDSIDMIMISTGAYWMQNESILEVISQSGHQEILINSFIRNYPEFLSSMHANSSWKQSQYSEYNASIISSMISGALLTWAKLGQKETPEELWNIIHDLFKKLYILFM